MATNDKYDRQLRLWGANGQRALMTAHILLINADAVGTETLKNLVLPGIGRFTVLDDKLVTAADLGNNFFVTANDVGRPRAEVVAELLCEMNPDVVGFALTSYPNNGSVNMEFWSQFSLIIAANMAETSLLELASICADNNLPLMLVRSYGLLGSCRLQLNQHEIIESKPDSDPYDLRISNPFPELEAYCQGFNMNDMESHEHSHTPYIVILYHAIQQWRHAYNGKLPTNFTEKESFKKTVKEMSRDIHKEQNFETAGKRHFLNIPNQETYLMKEAYRAFTNKTLPDEVLDLLAAQEQKVISAESSEFEFLLRALQLFLDAQIVQTPSSASASVASPSLQGYGVSPARSTLPPAVRWNDAVPPLGGSIPDMVSTTTFFVGLQQVYQTKAHTDRQAFKSILSNILSEATRTSVPHAAMKMTRTSAADITDETIDIFCRNVFNLRTISTRRVQEERVTDPCVEALSNVVEELSSAVDDPSDDPAQTPLYWYLALRAAERFQVKHQRWPGMIDAQLAGDTDAVWQELQQLVQEYGGIEIPHGLSRSHAEEVVRYGSTELHTISALIGGVAAQEAVKIITRQYVPLNNTFVYNGVAGCGATYEL